MYFSQIVTFLRDFFLILSSMKRFALLIAVFFGFLASGCGGSATRSAADFTIEVYTPEYASGFDIRGSDKDAATLVTVRNPLAGPYVLGISSGAGLGVALFLLGAPLLGVSAHSFVQSLGIAGAAWLGAALVLLVVMAVSRRIKDIMVILILGMMFGSGISSVVEILQYLSSEAALKSFVIWTMGSLGDVTGGNLALMLPVIAAGLVLSVAAIKPLNLLLLGENYARTMGLNVQRTRTLLFLSTVLLAGTVTAFCGPVGFIGLAVPHLARMLFASADHRILMPGSMLAGAALLLVCDLISKTLALPINTVTALMGIPVVIIVVVRNRNLF